MWTHLRQLDGLRAVAVLLVVVFHAGIGRASGGFVGVDVFFVLSGLLVGGVLLAEVDRTGTLRLGHFYARRVRRLLPASLVVIVATALLWVLLDDAVARFSLAGDARSALLYVANWRFLAESENYFAVDDAPSPFLHFWSLAIEEQFYVVFPLLVLLVVRRAKRPVRTLAILVAGAGALSVAAQLFWSQARPLHAYFGTDARVYQLLAGVLLMLVIRRHRTSGGAPRPVRLAGAAAWAGGLGLVLVASNLLPLSPTWRGFAATGVSVLLIGGVVLAAEGLPATLLALPLPVYLGEISYGIYLWHWPVLLAVRTVLDVHPLVLAAIGLALSAGLAALSAHVLEVPVRRARRLDPFGWRVVASGLTASAVLAAFVVGPVLASPRRPALAAPNLHRPTAVDVSATGQARVPAGLDLKGAAAEGPVHTCPADDPQACVLERGRGPHLLLVGDSNAEMFVPALRRLARERGFTFSANVVSGCWWATGPANRKVSAALKAECRGARGRWYDEALPRLKPDVVLLVQRPRETDDWARPGRMLTPDEQADLAVSARTATDTLHALSRGPWKVLVLESVLTPRTFQVLPCLAIAKTLGECSVQLPAGQPVMDAVYRSVAATDPDVWTVGINDLVCPQGPLCLPVRDGVVVWRDQRHLTLDYVEHEQDRIWARLVASPAMAAFR